MKFSTIGVFACCVAVAGASCRPAGPSAPAPVIGPPLVPAPLPPPNPKLPPVPEVRGPVRINVVYPKPEQLLTVRDSNFIFGSVGTGDAALRINGMPVPVWPNGAFMGWLAVPPDGAPHYELLAGNATEMAALVLPVKIPPVADTMHREQLGDTLNPVPPPPPDTLVTIPGSVYVALGNPTSVVNDTDRVTIAMPEPRESGQVYKWFLFPGTRVKVTGVRKLGNLEFVRIALDSTQEAWVLRSELARDSSAALPGMFVGDSIAPSRQVGAVRIEPTAEWIDIVVPVAGPPPPYLVEEADRAISLLVYGVSGAPVISMMPEPTDTYVNGVSSTPELSRVRYTVNLNGAPYGYLALWQKGTLTFRVRRPPRIADTTSPLRGLTITVDPGHPPAGAIGPTELYEGEAVLAVGLRLRELLAERGANVVMTRTTMDPVELYSRALIGRRANAHAFVSIHLDADPDGQNPFLDNGTWTLYFWPHSSPLARAAQSGLVNEMGLRDKGTAAKNLAVVRGTWMPSILTEGAFIIMPDQEAALRTPTYQDAYARGILKGLESYFASLAQAR
jgi:N-acetylmuramoyl-L-alanine amidase